MTTRNQRHGSPHKDGPSGRVPVGEVFWFPSTWSLEQKLASKSFKRREAVLTQRQPMRDAFSDVHEYLNAVDVWTADRLELNQVARDMLQVGSERRLRGW